MRYMKFSRIEIYFVVFVMLDSINLNKVQYMFLISTVGLYKLCRTEGSV